MRITSIILTLIMLTACNPAAKKHIQPVKDNSYSQTDTVTFTGPIEERSEKDIYDSLAKAFVDTSSLKGKRQWIMNQFLVENRPSVPDFDTLFDLTYDGYKDYIIGYYGQVGTGFKNKVKVFFYNSKKNCYMLNEQLSDLPNPSFYTRQKKITGFYIGNGGGGGGRLEWLNGKWTTTKEFDVENEGDTTKWKISYPLKNKQLIIVQPYQMIPPGNILETKINDY